MTTILFPAFYKAHGVRRLQTMLNPTLKPLLQLPTNSVLHAVSFDKGHLDIDTSKLFYGANLRHAVIDYQQELLSTLGGPRPHSEILQNYIRPFLKANRRFRYSHDPLKAAGSDPNTLVVYNYSYLQKLFKYTPMPMNTYNEWYNITRTQFKKINELAKTTDKNHFVFCDVPKDIPSLSLLSIFQDKNNTGMLKIFDTPEELFLLNMYRWLQRDEVKEIKDDDLGIVNTNHDSVFVDLERAALPRVNIVFTNGQSNSVVLNLGYLNSWIKGELNQTEFDTVEQLTPAQLQKVLLKFLISTRSVTEVEEQVTEETIQQATDTSEDLIDDDESDEPEDKTDVINNFTNTVPVHTVSSVSVKDVDIDKGLDLADASDLDAQLAALDEDIEALDTVSKRKLKDKGIHLEKTGEIVEQAIVEESLSIADVRKLVYHPIDAESALREHVEKQVDFGLLSAADYRGFNKDIDNFKQSKDPYGSNQTVSQARVVTPELLELDAQKVSIVGSEFVQDPSMLESSLLSFDKDYINNVMKKDMLSMVHELQRCGVAVRKHSIEVEDSVLGSYESHTLELKPVDGQASTVRFKVPVINEDGTTVVNGNRVVMRKQRTDLPIRKIKPTEVALTSYYGKTFVRLNSKKSNSSLGWLIKELNLASMSGEGYIKRVNPAKVFDNNFVAPFIYNALADNFKSIETDEFTLVFDHSERKNLVNDIELDAMEENGARVVGITKGKRAIVVDKNDQFSYYKDGTAVPVGDIFDILRLDKSAAPVDFSEVNVFSKSIPVGIFLGFNIGFANLLKLLAVPYRTVDKTGTYSRNDLKAHDSEFTLVFKDKVFFFERKHKVSAMILSGFNEFEKLIKMHEVAEFNRKDIYLNLLENKGLSGIYMREIDLMSQLFVDPITRGILEEMKEPQTLNGLLIRATELLQTYHHPDSQDMSVMRVRGYERVPGAVYKEMVTALRQYRNRNIAGKSKVDISPYQIWSTVVKDPAMKLIEDINPIQNLKEVEIVTYSGEGGRGKDSMNKASRAYHVNDMGIVSEATVDSSDVGVNAYLSANPKFINLRGIPDPDKKKIAPSSLISTSALLAPGSDGDDIKRVNFISVQQGHTIAAHGYHQPVVRTGYEYVIANRTTETFAYTAKQDGVVKSITDSGIVVDYNDGSSKGVTLGRIYGKAEGSVYPHDIITDLKVGQKFTKGTAVAYNKGFFEKDILDPTKIVMKNSRLTKVALYESAQTHEDSCAISPKMSESLKASTTKMRSFVIDFKQNLINVVKPGQAVNPKTLLMIIEDEITASSGAFDEQSLSALKELSNQAPKASYLGTVDKIEVFYNGDKSDMSSGLRSLADRSDRLMAETCKSTGKPVINGLVNADYQVSGTPLVMDKAEVRFYITVETKCATGDKVVAANQMKSVVGEVMDYTMTTEDGTEIEMVFGGRSIMARIVTSPFIMGTTATLLDVVTKKAVELYRS